MIFDGELMYVHTNFKDNLHYLKNDGKNVIATPPLNDNENWNVLKLNKLYCLNESEVIYK